MTCLNYRDYQGSVEYVDGRLLIRVLHIDDFITTECDAASEAESEFEKLVDDYIATCESLGREPHKPFKGSFNVRMTPELHREIAMAAASIGETLNGWMVSAARKRLNARPNAEQIALSAIQVASGPSGGDWSWDTSQHVASLDPVLPEFAQAAVRQAGATARQAGMIAWRVGARH